VSDIVESLGSYVLSENVSEQTTHVVAGGNRRTVKVLSGISRGLWVLSLDWVCLRSCIKFLSLVKAGKLQEEVYGKFNACLIVMYGFYGFQLRLFSIPYLHLLLVLRIA